MLILFEHYLFHQRTEKGYPDLDMAHVIETLNKVRSSFPWNGGLLIVFTHTPLHIFQLDAGSPERILLQDEDTAMAIS